MCWYTIQILGYQAKKKTTKLANRGGGADGVYTPNPRLLLRQQLSHFLHFFFIFNSHSFLDFRFQGGIISEFFQWFWSCDCVGLNRFCSIISIYYLNVQHYAKGFFSTWNSFCHTSLKIQPELWKNTVYAAPRTMMGPAELWSPHQAGLRLQEKM